MASVVIDPRFCGPATSGHGGYSCGIVARHLDTPATVRLLRPPPLGRELDVVTQYYGGVELRDGEEVVAVAERRAPLSIESPDPVSAEVAEACEAGFMWLDGHPFPQCYACGTARTPGDAWRIFAGPTPDGAAVAARAVCPPDLVASDGTVPAEQVWAALDCVTAHPLPLAGGSLAPPWVLGTLAVDVLGRVRADAELVVMGWPVELDGRKFHAEGALFADGREVAVAQATWIQLRA